MEFFHFPTRIEHVRVTIKGIAGPLSSEFLYELSRVKSFVL